MKRIILALIVCFSVLGISGIASAHPPRYVRVYHPVYRPPVIAAPVIVQPPVVVPEIIRPVYHHYWWHRR